MAISMQRAMTGSSWLAWQCRRCGSGLGAVVFKLFSDADSRPAGLVRVGGAYASVIDDVVPSPAFGLTDLASVGR
jgi:hypothetical protein